MYSLDQIILVAVAGLFVGIIIMLVGFKLYECMVYPTQFSEPDDWPKEDWVIGYEVNDDES